MSDENDDEDELPTGGESPEPPEVPDAPLMLEDLGLTAQEKAQLLRDLKEAYYTGAYRVKFRERDVTYRSRAEMKALINELEAELRSRRPRKNVVLTTFRRGY